MAVTFDRAQGNSTGAVLASSIASGSFTVANQTNRIMEAWVMTQVAAGTPPTIDTATFVKSGVTQNFVVSSLSFVYNSGLSRLTYCYLFAPTVGAGVVTATATAAATSQMGLSVVALFNRDQTAAPVVEVSGSTGTGAVVSVSVPDTSAIPFVEFCITWRNTGTTGGTLSATSDTTVLRANASPGAGAGPRETVWTVAAGSNPYTATFTIPASTAYGYAAVRHPVAATSVTYSAPAVRSASVATAPTSKIVQSAPSISARVSIAAPTQRSTLHASPICARVSVSVPTQRSTLYPSSISARLSATAPTRRSIGYPPSVSAATAAQSSTQRSIGHAPPIRAIARSQAVHLRAVFYPPGVRFSCIQRVRPNPIRIPTRIVALSVVRTVSATLEPDRGLSTSPVARTLVATLEDPT